MGQKNRYILKSCPKRTPRDLPLVQSAQVQPSLSTLLAFNSWFLPFFSQAEALHSSTLCHPYECRRTGRPPPPSTPDTTLYEQHTYLPTHLPRDTCDIRIRICTMARDGSASAASENEVDSIYCTMQELRAAAAKQADACVAGVAWCGMWRVEGVSPSAAFVWAA